ncbi:hypothetical protein [Mesorhizobium sp. KR2-14]|uniref:hypothetical protein n=1 Tax=Mesorhizobium sp. KR2-14 TaxID=3156610 RepID=UPI0032B586AA
MDKFLFAFAAVLLGSGAALADSAPATVIVHPSHVVRETYAQALSTGDTAPTVKVVKQSRINYASAAAMQALGHAPVFNPHGGDAAPPAR